MPTPDEQLEAAKSLQLQAASPLPQADPVASATTEPNVMVSMPQSAYAAALTQPDPAIDQLYQSAVKGYSDTLKNAGRSDRAQRNADLAERLVGHLGAIGLGAAGAGSAGAGVQVLNKVQQDSQNSRQMQRASEQQQLSGLKGLIEMHNAGHLKGMVAAMQDYRKGQELALKGQIEGRRADWSTFNKDFKTKQEAYKELNGKQNFDQKVKHQNWMETNGDMVTQLKKQGLHDVAARFQDTMAFKTAALAQQKTLAQLVHEDKLRGQDINHDDRVKALQQQLILTNTKGKLAADRANQTLEEKFTAKNSLGDYVHSDSAGNPLNADEYKIQYDEPEEEELAPHEQAAVEQTVNPTQSSDMQTLKSKIGESSTPTGANATKLVPPPKPTEPPALAVRLSSTAGSTSTNKPPAPTSGNKDSWSQVEHNPQKNPSPTHSQGGKATPGVKSAQEHRTDDHNPVHNQDVSGQGDKLQGQTATEAHKPSEHYLRLKQDLKSSDASIRNRALAEIGKL